MKRIATIGALQMIAGCSFFRAPPPSLPPAPPLAQLPVEQLVTMPTDRPDVAQPLAPRTPDARITLSSANVDIRELLPVLAEAAGIDLVLSPEVTGRVSVNFQDVSAAEAFRAVLEQAGLGPAGQPLRPPFTGSVTFYQLPVNLDRADVSTIMRRYGVSEAVARWIVEAREP